MFFDPIMPLTEIYPKTIQKKLIPKYIYCTSIYDSGKTGGGRCNSTDKWLNKS